MTAAPLPYLEGTGKSRLSFEDIDQQYRLKVRSLISHCMPAVFHDLEHGIHLKEMRAEGIVPIMFFLQFEVFDTPLAFFSRVETRHRVGLCRSVTPGRTPEEPEQHRLLLDMQIELSARQGTGDADSLGGDRGHETMVKAGTMRGVHVMTRPLAPAGQRQVPEPPEPLRALQERPWEGAYPSVEGLHAEPEAYEERDAGAWQEQRSIWGLQNTDINQHVNVHEYIVGLENHFSRMLFGAGLAVGAHRMDRMDILFRKPFFKGDPFGLRGRLFVNGERTLLLGGCHRIDPEGQPDPRPSVAARIEGHIRPGA